MPTPRSESIISALEGRTDIRPIVDGEEMPNRIDHYAVLSQITNTSIENYLNDPTTKPILLDTTTIDDLKAALITDIHASTLRIIKLDEFAPHVSSLKNSQRQRAEAGNRWPDVSLNILAGTGTFVNVTSEVFAILESRLGVDAASHPKNWRIIDRIAKLNIHAFTAFQETYLKSHRFRNWSAFIDQLEVGRDGQIQFRAGYPGNASIRTNVIQKEAEWKKSDCLVDGSLPLGKLQDIPGYDSAIGCPVSFQPTIVEGLWNTYASHAHRIMTKPAIISSDDTEAFAQ